MKVIGLTGGIGTGKSTVSGFLKALGAVIIDADRVGHEILETDAEARREVAAAFGKEILAPDDSINRKKLGEIVFADSQALARLNQIMHLRIRVSIRAQIEHYRWQGEKVVVLEAPLLLEMARPSLADKVDEVWVTTAPEATVLKRLKAKSGMSETESLARIRSQMPAEEKVKRADVVIDTDCSLEELKAKVEELWQRLLLDT